MKSLFNLFLVAIALALMSSVSYANHGLNRFQQRQVNQANRAVARNVQRNFNNHHHAANVEFVPVKVRAVQYVPVQAVPVQAAPVYAPSCGVQAAPARAVGGCAQYFGY